MIAEDFSVSNSARLEEFNHFLNQKLTHSALRRPVSQSRNGTYHVSLRCDWNDVITLEELFDKWNEEDQQNRQIIGNFSIRKSIVHLFKFSTS